MPWVVVPSLIRPSSEVCDAPRECEWRDPIDGQCATCHGPTVEAPTPRGPPTSKVDAARVATIQVLGVRRASLQCFEGGGAPRWTQGCWRHVHRGSRRCAPLVFAFGALASWKLARPLRSVRALRKEGNRPASERCCRTCGRPGGPPGTLGAPRQGGLLPPKAWQPRLSGALGSRHLRAQRRRLW